MAERTVTVDCQTGAVTWRDLTVDEETALAAERLAARRDQEARDAERQADQDLLAQYLTGRTTNPVLAALIRRVRGR